MVTFILTTSHISSFGQSSLPRDFSKKILEYCLLTLNKTTYSVIPSAPLMGCLSKTTSP
jgi:hypothetical protein